MSNKQHLYHNDFQSVAENSPDVICRFSKLFEHIYVNPALEKTTGFPASNFIGKTPHQAGLSPDFADFWVDMIKTVFTNSAPHSAEFSFPTPAGEKFFHTLLVPEFNKKGRVETVLSMTRDITEMKLKQTAQEELLSIASHELKTPLTALKAFTQIVQSKLNKGEDLSTSNYFNKIQNHVDRLNKLVHDLLDVTSTESSRLTFNYEPFDIDALVNEVVEDMQITTSHKLYVKGKSGKTIEADKDKIAQILINLISNAIKYSPKTAEKNGSSSKVIVQIASTGDGVLCSVQDFGLGIPKVQQQRVFERFYRVNKGSKSPFGLGLGLYICAEIVSRHGGKIWVNSDEGKGSTFCFTLPNFNRKPLASV